MKISFLKLHYDDDKVIWTAHHLLARQPTVQLGAAEVARNRISMIAMLVFGMSSPEAPLVVEALAGASLVLTERDISGIDRQGSVDSHHWRMTFSFLTHPLVNSNMFK